MKFCPECGYKLDIGLPCENTSDLDNAKYLVVNLVTGENRVSTNPPDLYDNTCRTTELWLRRIPKGTFMMGSPAYEVGRFDDEIQHQVTLTKDYYMGIFPVTQRQWVLVMGYNPSYFKREGRYMGMNAGPLAPVEQVSYKMIRGSSLGAGCTANNDVSGNSFLGMLRSKTGLGFDLPTEAQWEYACRAGTTSALNNGKEATLVGGDGKDSYRCYSLDEVGWYLWHSYSNNMECEIGLLRKMLPWLYDGSPHPVGRNQPNAWGLYDMHGNVWERCLDTYESYPLTAVTDPVGTSAYPVEEEAYVVRGGSWQVPAQWCRSARRARALDRWGDKSYLGSIGFRLALVPAQ